jgi:hypothetical protein
MGRGKIIFIFLLFFVPFLLVGCDEDMQFYKWNLVTLTDDGCQCGNGTPYKFFVNPSMTSKNVLIYFEAGGACWDYPSCSGQAGIRGAANPNGIPDDYMEGFSIPALMSPFVFRLHPWDSVPTKDWTIVFIPYCTGDIHIGNNDMEYEIPGEEGTFPWHHAGYNNVQGVLDWMKNGKYSKHFNTIPNLMVTGCSAGGAGAFLNYHFIREGLGNRVENAILLNDSGPIYYTDGGAPGHSSPLHQKIKSAWNVDTVLDALGEDLSDGFDPEDFGTLNTALSNKYLGDRLAHTQFTMDAIYSGYSYENFHDGITVDEIHQYWAEDQDYLLGMYEYLQGNNMGYFVPYYRPFNESHCTCVLSFDDTDITGTGMDMGSYVEDLMDDNVSMGAMRYYEPPDSDELTKPYWGWELLDLLMEMI